MDPGGVSRRSTLAAAAALGASAVAAPVAGAAGRSLGAGVTVVRDTWGTPHIYAASRHGLFYGYGYSIAEDRLFQLDMARRSFTGRVAEVLGPDWIEHDRSLRSDVDADSVREQYGELSQRDREIFEGYADGVNARIDEVLADTGSLLPEEYGRSGFRPDRFTGLDVVMIFVATMAHRYSDATSQPENLAVLRELVQHHGEAKGERLFQQIVWRDDPDAPTTVPPSDAQRRESPRGSARLDARQRRLPSIDVPPATAPRAGADASPAHTAAVGLAGGGSPADRARFSNAWLIGGAKTASGGAILVNGPQFGFFQPAYTYSVGLHGAGFDVVGNTPFGYPAILFGHNGDIAWGATAGMGATVDVYAEQLNPEDPREYLFDGSYRRMGERTETIAVRGREPVEVTVRSTVHGPVVASDPDRGVAYSKKRSWAGLEVESLLGWIDSTRARSWSQWLRQASRNATTINWYYADRRGNIGYVHTGAYPRRHPDADPRLPASGTGDMEWRGLQPFSWNPKVLNPEQGFLTNWNNKPAPGYEGSGLWGAADRVREIDEQLAGRSGITPQQAWQVIRDTSFVDVNARYFVEHLVRAVADLPPGSEQRRAVELVRSWDRTNVDRDGDGHYDHPGGAIMRRWLERMLEHVLAGELPPRTYQRYADAGYLDSSGGVASVNVQPGAQLLHNALRGADSGVEQQVDLFAGRDPHAVVRAALATALRDLREQHGPDMRAWRAPVVPATFGTANFTGVPQAGEREAVEQGVFANRGSENNMVSLEPGRVEAVEVVAPGQSGFVAPDGATGPHYRDQLGLFFDFAHKPVWLRRSDVLAHRESVRTLRE
ncbi:penicillin acylase family protein [Salinifilum ghardaiensis]